MQKQQMSNFVVELEHTQVRLSPNDLFNIAHHKGIGLMLFQE